MRAERVTSATRRRPDVAVVAVVAAVAGVVGCGGPTERTEPATTIASSGPPPSTRADTTADTSAAPATTAAAPTSTVAPPPEDGRLAVFTTPARSPSLDIDLVGDRDPAEYGDPWVSPRLVPGGVAVLVVPQSAGGTDPAAGEDPFLAVVDHDGSIRWRRQARWVAVAPVALEPDVIWVMVTDEDGEERWSVVDLATGADVPFDTEPSQFRAIDVSGRFQLRRSSAWDRPIDQQSRLAVIDLATTTVQSVPYPPGFEGRSVGDLDVTIHDTDPLDDRYVLIAQEYGPIGPRWAYVAGAWTTDPESVPAEHLGDLPVRASLFDEPESTLQLLDWTDRALWTTDGFPRLMREGFHVALANSAVLAIRCVDGCGIGDDGPFVEELVAVDRSTGRELWVMPGYRAVPVVAGDSAIVSVEAGEFGATGPGYVQIDVVSGERTGPSGDPWPAGSFDQECCGAGDYVFAQRDGGVVFTGYYGRLSVWYPEGAEPRARTLVLVP